MRLNALLSGFSPVALRGNEGSRPSVVGGVEGRARQDTLPADVFEQGQAWKNLAAASKTGVAGGRACACKTCAACAAQAYTEQAGGKENIAVSAAAAVKKEEKAAPVAGASGEGKTGTVGNAPQGAGQDGGEPVKEKTSQQALGGPKGVDGKALTQAQRLQVAELVVIDTKVRAHEMAHLAAAGSYATGGASFQYAKGPDGKQYAVGGEVGIDTGKESSPEATISKMQTVRAAALAPADPSPQDQKVAARASLVIAEAGQELQMVRLEQAKEKAAGKEIGQAGSGESLVAATDEKGGVPEEQPVGEGGSEQKPPATAQKAVAAIMVGLMRPASSINIAA
ncbi:MAG: putative metalloprotease CJM1_0395 family protein [Desulfobulbaceae bacterium]|nr:putative metalloprotease CJM1_0395 family protein [Desulfobulbaceae bacterium]HIJ90614.1 hypothetical protein [Deltaproteobacteria bacterium]